MSQREDLIDMLESSHAKMVALLNEVDQNREIYPLWTIREMLAHLSGWDEAVIGFVRSIMAGQTPATPATQGINIYNAESVAARAGLSYDQIRREFIETRELLLNLLRTIPEEEITAQYTLPWGDSGSLEDIVNILGPHDAEHAEDVEKLIAQNRGHN